MPKPAHPKSAHHTPLPHQQKVKEQLAIASILHKDMARWAKDFLNDPEQGIVHPGAHESPATYLSAFGLKTPKAVVTFLGTPAGHTVLEQIAEHVEQEEAFTEQSMEQRRERELLIHRIKIALFMWYLNKKAHASKKLNELITEQAEKSLERLHNTAKIAEPTSVHADYVDHMQAIIGSYEQIIHESKGRQQELNDRALLLTSDLELLMLIGAKLNEKYDAYENSLADDFFNNLLEPDGITINKPNFEQAYADLTVQMEQIQDEIDNIIEADGDPSEKIQALNALNLKFAVLHDMRAVSEGRKFYHRTMVDGEEMHYVLEHGDQLMMLDDNNLMIALDPKEGHLHQLAGKQLLFQKRGDQLVQDEDGEIYLLRPGEDLDTIKQDSEKSKAARQGAKESYERSKQEIMSVRLVIGYHKTLERNAHHADVQTLQGAIASNKAELELIANQIRLLQAVQADVKTELAQFISRANQTQISGPAPKLTPPMAPQPRMAPSSSTKKSSKMPTPTPTPSPAVMPEQKVGTYQKQALYTLADKMGGPRAREYLDAVFNLRLRNGAKPFTPQELITLQRRLEQFGVASPTMQKAETMRRAIRREAAAEEAPKVKGWPPTPFDMDPY